MKLFFIHTQKRIAGVDAFIDIAHVYSWLYLLFPLLCRSFGLLLGRLAALLHLPAPSTVSSPSNSSSPFVGWLSVPLPLEDAEIPIPVSNSTSACAKRALRLSPALLPLEHFEGVPLVCTRLYSLLLLQTRQLAAALAAARFRFSPAQSLSYSQWISLQFNFMIFPVVNSGAWMQAFADGTESSASDAILSPQKVCLLAEACLCLGFFRSKSGNSYLANLRFYFIFIHSYSISHFLHLCIILFLLFY